MGSYAFPTHYADGTPIYDTDFSTSEWPDSGTSSLTSDPGSMRWIYGELDYNKMVPPSASCMAALLPANNVVRAHTLWDFSKTVERPVVCKGTIRYLVIAYRTFILKIIFAVTYLKITYLFIMKEEDVRRDLCMAQQLAIPITIVLG